MFSIQEVQTTERQYNYVPPEKEEEFWNSVLEWYEAAVKISPNGVPILSTELINEIDSLQIFMWESHLFFMMSDYHGFPTDIALWSEEQQEEADEVFGENIQWNELDMLSDLQDAFDHLRLAYVTLRDTVFFPSGGVPQVEREIYEIHNDPVVAVW